jgi:dienelactone hydrolase
MTFFDLEQTKNVENYINVHKMLAAYAAERTLESLKRGESVKDAINSPEELAAYQQALRENMLCSMGGLPESAPLDPKITGVIKCEGYNIEKIIFCSRPETYVTANLYLPKNINSKRGAVLFLCGHFNEGKMAPEYQIVCRYLLSKGLIVLAMDPIGQGERQSYVEYGTDSVGYSVLDHEYAWQQCFFTNHGIQRYFVHDAMRAVDYLISRPEVDPAKIGVTGNSGGGTQTSLMMICDPRVVAAAPGTFITSRALYNVFADGVQDCEQIWEGMGVYGFDHEDILAAMAPKPVLVLAVKQDFFLIEGTRHVVERASRLWELCGCRENLSLVEDDDTHHYTPHLAQTAASFFAKCLLDEKADIPEVCFEPLEQSRLYCCKDGQVLSQFPGAHIVWHENAVIAAEQKAKRYREYPKHADIWLRKKIINPRSPCDPNIRIVSVYQMDEIKIQSGFYFTQPRLVNHVLVLRNAKFHGDIPITIALWRGGHKNLKDHAEWIRSTCASGRAVAVICLSGEGCLLPDKVNENNFTDYYGTLSKINRDLFWLGDSLAALRIYDILRSLDALALWPGIEAGDIRIYARDYHTVYAKIAAFMDKRIRSTECDDSCPSLDSFVLEKYYNIDWANDIVIPGMFSYFDVNEF